MSHFIAHYFEILNFEWGISNYGLQISSSKLQNCADDPNNCLNNDKVFVTCSLQRALYNIFFN